MEPTFSDANVLRVAVARKLLGALDPAEMRYVIDHLQKWVPTSPWGWLLVFDGDPLEIVHITEQDAADRAIRREGFRARLHRDPFVSEVLERLDAFRGEL
jgi:hypothetical protein